MIKRCKKMNNNSGFTMLELLITIAIMMLMVGIAVLGYGLLAKGDSDKAVKSLSSQITELRTNTLSIVGPWHAELYMDGMDYKFDIVKQTTVMSSVNLGSKLKISYEDSVHTSQSIGSTDKIYISFKQGSGSIDQLNAITASGGTTESLMGIPGTKSIKGNIKVETKRGTRMTNLTLWYETGKITTN